MHHQIVRECNLFKLFKLLGGLLCIDRCYLYLHNEFYITHNVCYQNMFCFKRIQLGSFHLFPMKICVVTSYDVTWRCIPRCVTMSQCHTVSRFTGTLWHCIIKVMACDTKMLSCSVIHCDTFQQHTVTELALWNATTTPIRFDIVTHCYVGDTVAHYTIVIYYDTLCHCDTVLQVTLQHCKILRSAVTNRNPHCDRGDTVAHCGILWHNATQYGILWLWFRYHTALCYNVYSHIMTYCDTRCGTLQFIAILFACCSFTS